ncbi:hypothetical protein SAMN04487991_0505 [Celeribacter neptunius]|uniref:Uncharacterized protein n=1 Tax=Celeribacter neptunius TaxID=588602 RepID=A0A1I3JXV5_9RHOB|nr:hypothetical protein SAMN04487991_0505 [Celeribacter neptunius]
MRNYRFIDFIVKFRGAFCTIRQDPPIVPSPRIGVGAPLSEALAAEARYELPNRFDKLGAVREAFVLKRSTR